MTNQHLSEQRFSDFPLPDAVMQGVREIGFEFCTPIQASTLTPLLEGKDIAGQAQTGTGKTAAFLVAMFAHLLNHPAQDTRRKSQPRGFILAPTRELAIQIHNDAVALNKGCGFKLALAYGGVDYEKQRKHISDGVDILIGTPGRIIDYHKQHVFDLKACQVLVLDEADRMFDLGFIKDLRFLLRRCSPPDSRLSMLFSATLSYRVMELAYEHMNDPQKIEIKTENVTADNVEQTVFYPANDEKIPLLIGLLNSFKPNRSIVFTNTKRAAEKIFDWLNMNDHKAAVLSGDVPQHKRQRLLGDFGEGKYSTLIATDVAARGLHIPDVSHIFNFDLPQSAEDYVHRIGRTARAGKSGAALSFACEDTSFFLPDIEAYIERKIPMGQVTDYLAEDLKQPARRKPRPHPHPGTKHGGHRPGQNKHSQPRNHRKPRPSSKTKV